MRRFIAYALGTAGMVVFYFGARFLVTGINADFGTGVAVGAAIMIALFWLVDRFTEGGLGGR